MERTDTREVMTQQRLIRSEGRHYGARYHTLKPEGYTPNWDNQIWGGMVEWAVEQFGAAGSLWDSEPHCDRWYVNNAKFWFRDEEDAIMFILRWS